MKRYRLVEPFSGFMGNPFNEGRDLLFVSTGHGFYEVPWPREAFHALFDQGNQTRIRLKSTPISAWKSNNGREYYVRDPERIHDWTVPADTFEAFFEEEP